MEGKPASQSDLQSGDWVAVQLEARQWPYWIGLIDHLGPLGDPWFVPSTPGIAPLYLTWQKVVVIQRAYERRARGR